MIFEPRTDLCKGCNSASELSNFGRFALVQFQDHSVQSFRQNNVNGRHLYCVNCNVLYKIPNF